MNAFILSSHRRFRGGCLSRFTVLFLLASLFAARAWADPSPIYWNLHVDGNWSNPSNWIPSRVPLPTDDVIINFGTDVTPGTIKVTMDVDATVASLSIGGSGLVPKLRLEGHNLTVTGGATLDGAAEIDMEGGALALNSGFSNTGDFEWSGGTVQLTGTFTNYGKLSYQSAGVKTLSGGVLEHHSTNAVVSGSGDIVLANGAQLSVLAGSALDFASSASVLQGGGAVGTLINEGSITDHASSHKIVVGVPYKNSGTLAGGALVLSGGGTNYGTIQGSPTVLSGSIHKLKSGGVFQGGDTIVDPGATLYVDSDANQGFSTPLNLNGGTIDGPGQLSLVDGDSYWTNGVVTGVSRVLVSSPASLMVKGGGTVTLQRPLLVGANAVLTIDGGTLAANGALGVEWNGEASGVLEIYNGSLTGSGNLSVEGSLNWFGGTISGSGAFHILGSLRISSDVSAGSDKVLSGRILTVDGGGAVSFQSGPFYVQSGAAVVVDPAAKWDIDGDLSITEGGVGPGSFTNHGLVSKISGSGDATFDVPYTNDSTNTVVSGRIVFASDGTHTGVYTGPGYLISGGVHNVSGGASLGMAALTLSGGTLNLNVDVTSPAATNSSWSMSGGTLSGTGSLTIGRHFDWTGGTVSIAHGVTVPAGSQLDVTPAGPATLSGTTVTVASGGKVAHSGSFPWQLSNQARIQVDQGGEFDLIGDGVHLQDATPDVSLVLDGALKKTSGNGVGYLDVPVTQNGNGSMQAVFGELALRRDSSYDGTFSGVGFLFPSGVHTFLDRVSLGATGFKLNGGTWTLPSSPILSIVHIPAGCQFVFASGTINGGGELVVVGQMTWTGGTISGNGALSVDSGGFLYADGTSNVHLTQAGRSLTVHSGGQLELVNGVNWDVSGGATLEVASGGNAFLNGACALSGAGTLVNNGTLTKTLTTGTATVGLELHQSGQISVEGGVLALTHTHGFQPAPGSSLSLRMYSGGVGQLSVLGAAAFNGGASVDVFGGFAPTYGQTYTLVTYGSRSGTFSGVGGLNLAANGTLVAAYTPNAFVLTSIAGAEYVWTGAVSTDWSAAGNWSPAGPPGVNDRAILNSTARQPVLATSTTISNLVFNSGTLSGSGTLVVKGSASEWSSGALDGTGHLVVGSGAALALKSGADKFLNGGWVLENRGSTLLSDGGRLVGNSGSGVTNLGAFVFASDSGIYHGGTGARPSFGNGPSATLKRAAVAGANLSGLGFDCFLAGDIVVESGLIVAEANVTILDGVHFSGAGTFKLAAGSHTTLAGAFWAENVLMAGASLTGSGNLTAGTLNWTGGEFVGPSASLAISVGATLGADTSSGALYLNNGFQLANQGLVLVKGANSLLMNQGSTLVNSGVLEFVGDGSLADGGVAPAPSLQNNANGTVRRPSRAGVGQNLINVPVTQDGVFEVLAGSVQVAGGMTLDDGADFTGAGKTVVSSGATTLNGAFTSANLVLGGGTVSGTGSLAGGSLYWTGGTLSGPGTLAINSLGSLQISGPDPKIITGGFVLNNQGTTTLLTGSASVHGAAGAIIQNSGTFDLAGDVGLLNGFSGTAPSFQNTGNLLKSAGGGVSPFEFVLPNSGTVEVQSGILQLTGGGSNSSVWTAGVAGTLSLNAGSFSLQGGATLAGAGVVAVNGAVLSVTGSPTVSGLLALGSGQVTGGGNLVVNHVMNWTGGSLSGTGMVTIAASGQLNLSGGSTKAILQRALVNQGTMTWGGPSDIVASLGAVITNTGSLTIMNDQVMANGGVGAMPTLYNPGTIVKTASTGTTVINIAWVNTGVVAVNSGSIRSGASMAMNAGTSAPGGGALILDGGVYTLGGDVSATNLVFVSGTLSGSGQINGVLHWAGGCIQGSAGPAADALHIPAGSTLSLEGNAGKCVSGLLNVKNDGTILASGDGSLIASQCTITNHGIIRFTGRPTWGYSGSGSVPVLVNEGVVEVDNGVPANTVFSSFAVYNNGLIHALSGRLMLSGGGGSFPGSEGSFTSEAGATLAFIAGSTPFRFDAPVVFNGGGAMQNNGATMVLAADLTIATNATFQYLFGSMGGSGNLVVHGRFQWNGFELGGGGSGQAVVEPGGVLEIGSGSHASTGPWSFMNHGQIQWLGGDLLLSAGAAVTNAADGVFEARSDNAMGYGGSGANGRFVNLGSFQKVAGSMVTAFNPGIDVVLGGSLGANTGDVEWFAGANLLDGVTFSGTGRKCILNGGIYSLDGTVHSSGLLLKDGSFTGNWVVDGTVVWEGGSLEGPGFPEITSTGVLNLIGANDKYVSGSVNLLNRGRITLDPGSSGHLRAEDFTLENQGTLELLGTGGLAYTYSAGRPLLLNPGTLRRSGSGLAPIEFNVETSGSTRIESGGLQVTGSYQPSGSSQHVFGISSGSSYGQLTAPSGFPLAGVLSVQLANGYTPARDDWFQLISAPSLTGSFGSFAGATFPSAPPLQFRQLLNPSGLGLQVVPVNNLPPTLPTLSDLEVDAGRTVTLGIPVSDDWTLPGSIVLMADSSLPAVVPQTNLVITGTGGSRTLTIIVPPASMGTTIITLNADDGEGQVGHSSFKLNVNPVTVPPAAWRLGDNLIGNFDAEAGAGSSTGSDVVPVPFWRTSGGFTVVNYGSPDFIMPTEAGPPVRGHNFFAGGPANASSYAKQVIDVSAQSGAIDTGTLLLHMSGFLGGWSSQDDAMVMQARLLDGSGNQIAAYQLPGVSAADRTNQNGVLYRRMQASVPGGTRRVEVTLVSTRTAGSYNDGYADNLMLAIGHAPTLAPNLAGAPFRSGQSVSVDLGYTSPNTGAPQGGDPYRVKGYQLNPADVTCGNVSFTRSNPAGLPQFTLSFIPDPVVTPVVASFTVYVADGLFETNQVVNIPLASVNQTPTAATIALTTPEDSPLPIAETDLLAAALPGAVPGLTAKYFIDTGLTQLAFTRTETSIDHDYVAVPPGPPVGSAFSVQYTGFIAVPKSGDYTFYLTSDDGVRLFVDGNQIINAWGPQSLTESVATVRLVAGQYHPIQIDYFEDFGGGADLTFAWSGPDLARELVPVTAMFHGSPETSQTLTLSSVDSVSAAGGIVTRAGGVVTYTPPLDYSGLDSFHYSVVDNGTTGGVLAPLGATGVVQVAVTPVNDPPVIAAPSTLVVEEDGSALVAPIVVTDVDGSVFAQAITIASPRPATLTMDTLELSLSVTNGVLFFSNAPPALTVTLGANPSVSLTVQAPIATLNEALTRLYYKPNPDYNGVDTLTMSANDQLGGATRPVVAGVGSTTSRFSKQGAHAQLVRSASSQASVAILVTPVNDAPVVGSIADVVLAEDSGLTTIPVTVSDIDTSLTGVTVAAVSSNPALTGVFTSGGAGGTRTLGFTPAADASGSATVTVTANDGLLNSLPVTFRVVVTPVNDAPAILPVADRVIAEDSGPVQVPFTITDIDSPSTSLGATALSSNPALVAVVGVGGIAPNLVVTLQPQTNANGVVSITLTGSDGQLPSVPVVFQVQVTPVNDAPVIAPVPPITLAENAGPTPITLTLSDVDSPAGAIGLTVTSSDPVLLPPANLVVSPATSFNRTLTITPILGKVGTATLTLQANDGAGGVSTQLVAVTVRVANTPPGLGPISSQSMAEDSTLIVNLSVSDAETPSGLVVTAVSSDPALVPASGLSVGGTSVSPILVVKPAPDASGKAQVTVTVTDPAGATAVQTFQLVVTPVNDAPVIGRINPVTIMEDSGTVQVPVTVTDVDSPLSNLTLTGSSSDPAIVGRVVLSGSAPNFVASLTPSTNAFGTVIITLVASDGQATSSTTFPLVITPVNDAPVVASLANLTVDEDSGPVIVPVTLSDVDSAAETVNLSATPSNPGLVSSITSGGSGLVRTLVIGLVPNAFGMSTITVVANDGLTNSAPVSFQLLVRPVNDAPVIGAIDPIRLPEDPGPIVVPVQLSDVDNPVESLSLTAAATNPNLFPPGSVSVRKAPGVGQWVVTLQPIPDANGSSVLSLVATDGDATTRLEVPITLTPVNDPPVLGQVTDVSFDEDTVFDVDLKVTDPDSPLSSLSVVPSTSDPTIFPPGSMQVLGTSALRTLRLKPATNAFGVCRITVVATDALGASSSVSFQVTVVPVNDPPTLGAIGAQHTKEGVPIGPVVFRVGDVETPAGLLQVSVSSDNQALFPPANLVLGGAGADRTLTLTPNGKLSGTATITVTVQDGQASTSTTFPVTVDFVNDLPEISALAPVHTLEDTVVGPVDFNVADQETAANGLLVTATSSNPALIPASGIVLGGSGVNRTITLQPATNAFGRVTISLTVQDGDGGRSHTDWVVTIDPVNDLPGLVAPESVVVDAELPSKPIKIQVSDVETPVAELLLTAVSSDQVLLPPGSVVLGGSGADRTLQLTPAAGRFGKTTLDLTLTDGDGGVVHRILPVEVKALAPKFVRSPVPVSVPLGRDAAFHVVATGTALHYQWRFNDGPLPGQDKPDLSLTKVSFEQAGLYSVQVTNGAGVIESVPVVLQVIIPPTLVTPPSAQTVSSGANVSFGVAASGTAPLFYQWQHNNKDLPDATLQGLNLREVTVAQSGEYRVTVSNGAGSVTSDPVMLSVLVPPAVTEQPRSQALRPGETLTLRIGVTGNGPFVFQWRLNGVNISGANSETYTIASVTADRSGSYTVVVSSPSGTATSDPAVVTVEVPVSSLPDNFADRRTIAGPSGSLKGDNLNASAESGEPNHGGLAPRRSVWLKWTAPGTGVASFSTTGSSFDTTLAIYTGSTLAGLRRAAFDLDSGGFLTSRIFYNVDAGVEYSIAIDGFNGAAGQIVFSWDLDQTPHHVPTILENPRDQTVAEGSDVTFHVSATVDSGELNYRWLFNGQIIPGEIGDRLTITKVSIRQVGFYSVQVSSGLDSVVTSARLQVNQTETGGSNPDIQTEDKFADASGASGGGTGPVQAVFAVAGGRNTVGIASSPVPQKIRRSGAALARGYSGSQIFNTFGSTTESGEPNHCGVIGGASQWFSYSAESDGNLMISTGGSDFDTVLAVYTGDGSSFDTLTLLACDDNGGPNGITSLVRFPAKKGTTYFVAVDGVNGATGQVKLTYKLDVPLRLTGTPMAPTPGTPFVLQIAAQQSGLYALQSSTNMLSWITVASTNLTVARNDTVLVSLTDTNASPTVFKFYRAVVTPAP